MSTQIKDNQKGFNYKIAFWITLALWIISVAILFYMSGKSELLTTETKGNEGADTTNYQYRTEDTIQLGDTIVNKSDSAKLSLERRRQIQIIDSLIQVKDSINFVLEYMNDSTELETLSTAQVKIFIRTQNVLGAMKIKLDLALDRIRIDFLKQDVKSLSEVISQFDDKVEKLGKLAKTIKRVSGFIGKVVDVAAAAVSAGILKPPVIVPVK